jgi:hypothetical protein
MHPLPLQQCCLMRQYCNSSEPIHTDAHVCHASMKPNHAYALFITQLPLKNTKNNHSRNRFHGLNRAANT